MTTHRYAFQGYDGEKMVRVVGRDLPISTKQAIEICSFIRGKKLHKAQSMLIDVIKMKMPVPFRRFTEGAGHKKGKIAAGRYPVKASGEILALLNSLEANAQQKGLSTLNLAIKHACAQQASRPPRYGRIRGRRAKRSHVEFVAAEGKVAEEKAEKKAKEQPAARKTRTRKGEGKK